MADATNKNTSMTQVQVQVKDGTLVNIRALHDFGRVVAHRVFVQTEGDYATFLIRIKDWVDQVIKIKTDQENERDPDGADLVNFRAAEESIVVELI